MAKPGPKPKIDAAARKQIYAVLTVGGSLSDAAGILGVNTSTLRRAKTADKEFARGVKEAIRKGKLTLIKRIGKARQWQAAAWMLERRWGKRFGRKDRQEVTGKDGGPIQYANKTPDPILADAEATRLANALARRLAVNAGGDGQSPN